MNPVMTQTGDAITKFVFKIDGCLKVSERAATMEMALERTKRMWPRSTVEFVEEQFSHVVDTMLTRTPSTAGKKRSFAPLTRRPAETTIDDVSLEDRMAATLVDSFGGHA